MNKGKDPRGVPIDSRALFMAAPNGKKTEFKRFFFLLDERKHGIGCFISLNQQRESKEAPNITGLALLLLPHASAAEVVQKDQRHGEAKHLFYSPTTFYILFILIYSEHVLMLLQQQIIVAFQI